MPRTGFTLFAAALVALLVPAMARPGGPAAGPGPLQRRIR
jgi:hypothetical protein